MRVLLAIVILLLLPANPSLAYRQTVGQWEISEFPSSGGSPLGCIMGGTYQDKTRLSIIVTTQYEWALGLSNLAWNLQKDGTTDVAVFVDQKFITSGKAKHWDRTIAVLPFANADAFKPLQNGLRLNLAVPGGNLNFALTGTGRAMYVLLDCVKSLQEQKGPSATTAKADYRMVPPAEAAVMLTNLFNAAHVQGWRLEPPKPNDDWISFNLASGASGFFRAARGLDTRTADDHAAHVISKLSELCKGNFLSAKQSVASVDGSVVRKVVTTCRGDTKGDVATETSIIRQPDGFLMELSHFMSVEPAANLGGSPDGPIKDDPSKDDRAAMVDAALRMRDTR